MLYSQFTMEFSYIHCKGIFPHSKSDYCQARNSSWTNIWKCSALKMPFRNEDVSNCLPCSSTTSPKDQNRPSSVSSGIRERQEWWKGLSHVGKKTITWERTILHPDALHDINHYGLIVLEAGSQIPARSQGQESIELLTKYRASWPPDLWNCCNLKVFSNWVLNNACNSTEATLVIMELTTETEIYVC